MNPWAIGENTTWPNEPAAAPIPSAMERRCGPTALAMTASASEKAVRETPSPVVNPAVRCSIVPVSAMVMPQVPEA